MTLLNKLQQTRQIALNDIRTCYKKEGVIASPLNFDNYWGRDTFWAIPGMINEKDKDLEKAKRSLELFAQYQRKDGKIPRKIVMDVNIFKRIGIRIKRPSLHPVYYSPIKYLYSLDENALFVIAFCEYVKKTNDVELAHRYFQRLSSALNFYVRKGMVRNSLIYELGFGNWMDTILKRGYILYTNCIWQKALSDFFHLSEKLGNNYRETLPLPDKVRKIIQKEFWNEEAGFFADALPKKGKQKNIFDTAGNVLSIFFDIANKRQSRKIFHKIDQIRSRAGLHPTNDPLYSFWRVNILAYLFGIQKYQNGISWSWIEIIHILALLKHNRYDQAQKQFDALSDIIIKNNSIHETYNLDGSPYDRLLWKSATPFAWSAGLFLLLIKKFEDADKN